jgi:anaerobic glycerol-3-phosphate dehydrogenase
MSRVLRALLLFEAATFVAAASIHFGAFLAGYDHRKAAIAETVIAVALVAGFVASLRRAWTRAAAVAAQAFALFGVGVGLFTIAVGVGPRTVADVLYHLGIAAVLAGGLAFAVRWRRARLRPWRRRSSSCAA